MQYTWVPPVHERHAEDRGRAALVEWFVVDAEVASRALGIKLTKRGKHLSAAAHRRRLSCSLRHYSQLSIVRVR